MTRFFTGKLCKNGHVAERFVANWSCVKCVDARKDPEKSRLRAAAARAANPKREIAKQARYRKRYPDKIRATWVRWAAANPEKASKKEYYATNKETMRAKQAIYYVENRDQILISVAEYRLANPEKISALKRNRYALLKAADGTSSADDMARIRTAQRDKCGYCRTKLHGKGHVDHIIAITNGGSNWPSNLQLLCAHCNLSKNAQDPITFARRRGMLL